MQDWDAATYDRIANPHVRWGASVLERLDSHGVRLVLDAGCGTGRVTEQLLERLPDARVLALDASPAMLEQARARLAPFGRRVRFMQADLRAPLPVERPVDAIVSTATFHWVLDHDALFGNLAAALRPEGQLVAQCGGAGNIARVLRVVRELGHDEASTWEFPTPSDTVARLRRAGFTDVEAWLEPSPARLEPGEPFETFLATVVLRPTLARLREEERAGFVREVATRLPEPEIDYVRLNVVARRAA